MEKGRNYDWKKKEEILSTTKQFHTRRHIEIPLDVIVVRFLSLTVCISFHFVRFMFMKFYELLQVASELVLPSSIFEYFFFKKQKKKQKQMYFKFKVVDGMNVLWLLVE